MLAENSSNNTDNVATRGRFGFEWGRLREPALALTLPLVFLVAWHFATFGQDYSLIPPPHKVALALYDLAFGGIRNDFFSGTLLNHIIASVSRVYGGFALAVIVALPLGLMIGRIAVVRQLFDPRAMAESGVWAI